MLGGDSHGSTRGNGGGHPPFNPLHYKNEQLQSDFGLSSIPALSIRTSRGHSQHPHDAVYSANAYLPITPHNDMENALQFIIPDGPMDPSEANFIDNLMTHNYIKSEPMSPGTAFLGSLPGTALAAAFHPNAFSFNEAATVRQWALDETSKRRRFVQRAKEIQLRAQMLEERENLELDRGAALQILSKPVGGDTSSTIPLQRQPSPKVPSPSTAKLHDCNPLGSPNNFALMASYHFGSPCFAEVRLLLDNTPTKSLSDFTANAFTN